MNRFIFSIVLSLSVVTLMPSCEEDFLERRPKDALSEETFFNTSNDLATYVNGLYGALPLYDFQAGIPGLANWGDLNADVQIVARAITASLNLRSSDGLAPLTSANWNNGYDRIRNTNFFLANYHRVKARDAAANQFIGEGYFFRAWHYYRLLVEFGDVPLILEPLNISSEELYRPSDSRYDVAKQIIKDLDSAIANLQWKGVGEARSGRVNKEAAATMKARVALFEGSWEYYHAANATPFAVQGKNGTDLLQLIISAVQELIDYQGTKIYKNGGPLNEPYNQLFAVEDGHTADGVFWFRAYDPALMVRSHNFYMKVNDTGRSITKRLIDMYLDKDGLPQTLSSLDFSTLDNMGQNLDPRFRQTIWTPDRGPMTKIPGRGGQGDLDLRYPVITEGAGDFTSTGLRMWKGAVLDPAQFRAGETDDILIRYAEALLAYAEAKAILGTITQTDLDKTVNLLRSRVNMEPIDLAQVNAWSSVYSESEGFDPNAANILNEIRRERTVELALEGFRLDDLKRWAVYEKVINGYKPKGAKAQEFVDYFNNPTALAADGWSGTINFTLTEGANYGVDADGYLNPYFRSVQFQEGGEGFWINKDRDYLSPVPAGQIDLYKQSGVTLTQNPGWN